MLLNIFINLLVLLSIPGNTEVISSPEFFETTTTGIGYGRPTAACDGSGVCFVSEISAVGFEDNFGQAKLTMSKSGSVSRIHASAKSMTKNTIEKHFSGDFFIMKDPYKAALKLNGKSLKIYIPAGKHKITKTKTGFLILIKG